MATHFLRRGKCHLRLVWPQNILRDMRAHRHARLWRRRARSRQCFHRHHYQQPDPALWFRAIISLCTGVVSTISLLFQALFAGAGQASQPLISMNYGARKLDRVQAVLRMGLATVGCMGVVFMLLGELFPNADHAPVYRGDARSARSSAARVSLLLYLFYLPRHQCACDVLSPVDHARARSDDCFCAGAVWCFRSRCSLCCRCSSDCLAFFSLCRFLKASSLLSRSSSCAVACVPESHKAAAPAVVFLRLRTGAAFGVS